MKVLRYIKKRSSLVLILTNLVLLVFLVVLNVRIQDLERLIFATDMELIVKHDYPTINFIDYSDKEFLDCIDQQEEGYIELYDEGGHLTSSIRVYIAADYDLDKVAFQLDRLGGLSLVSINEFGRFMDLRLERQDQLREYAYWMCFMGRQDFVVETNYGVGGV